MSNMEDLKVLIDSGYTCIRRVIVSKRNVVKNKLKLDTTSIIQNDYKLKLLKILKTQDKRIVSKISDNYC